MAKFCGNCGAQMYDNARVCGYCGTPLNEENNMEYGEGQLDSEKVDCVKKGKNSKLIRRIAIVVAAVLLVLTVSGAVLLFTSYHGAVARLMNAYKSKNEAEMIDMSCSFMQNTFTIAQIGEEYESMLKDDFQRFDYNLPPGYSIKYEIVDSFELSEPLVKELLEDFLHYGENEYSITAVMCVKIKIYAKEGDSTFTAQKTVYLGKERGIWKLVYFL